MSSDSLLLLPLQHLLILVAAFLVSWCYSSVVFAFVAHVWLVSLLWQPRNREGGVVDLWPADWLPAIQQTATQDSTCQ